MLYSNQLSKRNCSKGKSLMVFIVVLFVLICFYPYEFYSVYFPFLPDGDHYTATFFFVFICVISKSVNLARLFPYPLGKVFGFQIVGLTLVGLMHGNILNVFRSGVLMLLSLSLIQYVENNCGLFVFFAKYNRWILLMAVMGSIAFVLVTFYGLEPFYFVFDRADSRAIYNYLLSFTKTPPYDNFKYAGFFDEPGAMAYWILYALIFNRLFIRNWKFEYVLAALGVLTFSMGFYIQLALFLIFFNVKSTNMVKGFIGIIFVGVIVGGLYLSKGTQYSALYDITFERIENTYLEGKESGNMLTTDNRAELAEKAYTMFIEEPLFGSSRGDKEYLGDNIYEPLARYGIIGSLFVLFPLLFLLSLGFRSHNKDLLKAVIVIIVGFSHRPFHTELLHFFIVYSLIYMSWQQHVDYHTLNKKI